MRIFEKCFRSTENKTVQYFAGVASLGWSGCDAVREAVKEGALGTQASRWSVSVHRFKYYFALSSMQAIRG